MPASATLWGALGYNEHDDKVKSLPQLSSPAPHRLRRARLRRNSLMLTGVLVLQLQRLVELRRENKERETAEAKAEAKAAEELVTLCCAMHGGAIAS